MLQWGGTNLRAASACSPILPRSTSEVALRHGGTDAQQDATRTWGKFKDASLSRGLLASCCVSDARTDLLSVHLHDDPSARWVLEHEWWVWCRSRSLCYIYGSGEVVRLLLVSIRQRSSGGTRRLSLAGVPSRPLRWVHVWFRLYTRLNALRTFTGLPLFYWENHLGYSDGICNCFCYKDHVVWYHDFCEVLQFYKW